VTETDVDIEATSFDCLKDPLQPHLNYTDDRAVKKYLRGADGLAVCQRRKRQVSSLLSRA
jgi:hypothetical protein